MAYNPKAALRTHHKHSSLTSLSRLGLEVSVPPWQVIPVTSSTNNYRSKELPPLPNGALRYDKRRPFSDMAGMKDPKEKNISRLQHSNRSYGNLRPPIGSKSQSMPDSFSRMTGSAQHKSPASSTPRRPSGDSIVPLRPPPPPPMTTSARKVLQLTGFDASFVFEHPIRSHYSVSPDSSSSGSHYSREPQDYSDIPSSPWDSSMIPPTRVDSSPTNLVDSPYSSSHSFEESSNISQLSIAAVAGAPAAVSSLRTRTRTQTADERKLAVINKEDLNRGMTNDKLVILEKALLEKRKGKKWMEDHKRDDDAVIPSGHKFSNLEKRVLTPEPLALKSKENGAIFEHNKKLGRSYTAPVSTTGMPYDGMTMGSIMKPPPTPKQGTKRGFGTGKHPLKSPFPFALSSKASEARESEPKFARKFSGALKRFGSTKNSSVKQIIIWNTQRDSNGPDTPMPSSTFSENFQRGVGWQDAIEKAKKGLKVRTADEKRREDLKKKIVVVGLTDQSPDGRVSEWM